MNKVKLTITWDEGTDDLPTEFEIFITSEDMIEDIIDELSDNYGFAITSAKYEIVEENANPFGLFFTKYNPAKRMIRLDDDIVKEYLGNNEVRLTRNKFIMVKPAWAQIITDERLIVQTEDGLKVFELYNIKW